MLIKNRAPKMNSKHQNHLHCQHYLKLIKKTKNEKLIPKIKINSIKLASLYTKIQNKYQNASAISIENKPDSTPLKIYAINTLSHHWNLRRNLQQNLHGRSNLSRQLHWNLRRNLYYKIYTEISDENSDKISPSNSVSKMY